MWTLQSVLEVHMCRTRTEKGRRKAYALTANHKFGAQWVPQLRDLLKLAMTNASLFENDSSVIKLILMPLMPHARTGRPDFFLTHAPYFRARLDIPKLNRMFTVLVHTLFTFWKGHAAAGCIVMTSLGRLLQLFCTLLPWDSEKKDGKRETSVCAKSRDIRVQESSGKAKVEVQPTLQHQSHTLTTARVNPIHEVVFCASRQRNYSTNTNML